MLIEKRDLFGPKPKSSVICITTNGYVKNNGKAVMGAGVAEVAKRKFKGIDESLGKVLLSQGRIPGNRGSNLALGNHVAILKRFPDFSLVSFPTKWNFWEKSDLGLIERSSIELAALADRYAWKNIYLPRPGCGNGGLEWGEVCSLIEPYLDNRFIICVP